MNLEPRPKRSRRNESADLVRPIIVALNRMPGVRVVRNANLGPVVPWAKRYDPAARPIIAGLGTGSADVVGVVACKLDDGFRMPVLGRLFTLEVKLAKEDRVPVYTAQGTMVGWKPSRRAGTLEADQKRWLETVRRFGGYAAVVHSVEEAVACVEACRRGEDGSLPF